MIKRKTVAEVVNESPELQMVLNELIEKNFLTQNAVHPLSYVRNAARIAASWEKERARINAIAMGISLYSNYLEENLSSILIKKRPEPSKKTTDALRRWRRIVKHSFTSAHRDIDKTSRLICQHLEYVGRDALPGPEEALDSPA